MTRPSPGRRAAAGHGWRTVRPRPGASGATNGALFRYAGADTATTPCTACPPRVKRSSTCQIHLNGDAMRMYGSLHPDSHAQAWGAELHCRSYRHVRQRSESAHVVCCRRQTSCSQAFKRCQAIVPRTVPDRLCVLVMAQDTSCRAAVAGACSDAAVPTTNSVPLADWSCALPACNHQSACEPMHCCGLYMTIRL